MAEGRVGVWWWPLLPLPLPRMPKQTTERRKHEGGGEGGLTLLMVLVHIGVGRHSTTKLFTTWVMSW